jgi:trehalose 2-sulfotransferase
MGIEKSYIVAASPRTGSTLLCQGLVDTNIAGHPTECFSPHLKDVWQERWGLSSHANFTEYFDCAIRFGTTANNVYGLKIHWMHINRFAQTASFVGDSEEVLQALFPGSLFINIVRRDRRAQAISFFRANTTKQWHARTNWINYKSETFPEPSFDADAIRKLEMRLARQQLAWEQYFRKRGLHPLTIEYEVLADDYKGQIARALRYLGLDESVAQGLPPSRLVRQADEITVAWRQRLDAMDERSGGKC